MYSDTKLLMKPLIRKSSRPASCSFSQSGRSGSTHGQRYEALNEAVDTEKRAERQGYNMNRSSGILMPVFSLPSSYGCGTAGREAYKFIDWLAAAGQSYWQMLPVNHAGFGDSPYCCFSSFAGDPLFVDLELLADEGLLSISELDAVDIGDDETMIDYEKLRAGRAKLFEKAFSRFEKREELFDFVNSEERWLKPCAEFMAGKGLHSAEVYEFIQYCFYRQWAALKDYAHSKGIALIGDIPVYVPLDSAELNAEPQYFMLDEKGLPAELAGVPPDYFNSEGQLWGNPLYDWEAMKKDGYGWWIRRIDGALRLFDIVRIDHFRGFDSYWAVPAGEKSAKNGRWVKGPGMDFVGVICSWFGRKRFIAEDLGMLSDSVNRLLEESGLMGMKVLEFAFSPDMTSSYLPHNYGENCICYTGTHDNAPVMEWLHDADRESVENALLYCGCSEAELNIGLIRVGMASVAKLFIAPIQDWLGLGAGSRINTPGTVGGNWRWRLRPGSLTDELAAEIRRLTRLYGRERQSDPPFSFS